MKISKINSLANAGLYVENLKSRVAKDNAIRFFIKKFGWYIGDNSKTHR